MRDESKPYLLSIDIEHEGHNIIQLSGIMLKLIGENVYQICRNINIYIKQKNPISNFVQHYTNISFDFLEKYGVDLEEARRLWKEFLFGVNPDDILLFSHGINQDINIMNENGFDVNGCELWCTLNMSKWVLEREHNLTLQELSTEAGYKPISEHNAYSDALTNLLLFSYLLKIQGDD